MKQLIGRTLLWVKNENGNDQILTEKVYFLSVLLGRLLNRYYKGPSFKLINIYFCTQSYYEKFPQIELGDVHYVRHNNGVLAYQGFIDIQLFESLDSKGQALLLWKNAIDYLVISGKKIGNYNLVQSSEKALVEGLQTNLVADYRVIEKSFTTRNGSFLAAVWINFNENSMSSKFAIENNGIIVFEQAIDETRLGIEYFLEIYKSIIVEGEIAIVFGDKDVDYLPLKIKIPDAILK